MTRIGLRARVTAMFTVGALLLSVSLAALTYQFTRHYLLDSATATAIRSAYFDASIARSGLAGRTVDVARVLRSIDTGGSRRPLIRRAGQWYARTADNGITTAVPTRLRGLVERGQVATQRVVVDGTPTLVIGVPLVSAGAQFYEIDSLTELDHTLKVLLVVAALAALATSTGGGALGWWSSRRVLRPLTSVTATARTIAAGDLSARLDSTHEPDLDQLTQAFNHMVDEVSTRIELDRRFAAEVSHELRSPLQTLTTAVAVLQRGQAGLDPRMRSALSLLSDEVDRFTTLVLTLLELAKSDRPVQTTRMDVTQLIARICADRGVPAEAVEAGTQPRMWELDRARITQVLANLIDNARQYGGGVTAVRVSVQHHRLIFEVDDQGPGVPHNEREIIFARFGRGRAASARGADTGTGLGLALAHQHVTAHGGTITVTERPGGGARFRVELPERTPP